MPGQGRAMAEEELLGKIPINRDVCLGWGRGSSRCLWGKPSKPKESWYRNSEPETPGPALDIRGWIGPEPDVVWPMTLR